jgi:predicted dehydrogenase
MHCPSVNGTHVRLTVDIIFYADRCSPAEAAGIGFPHQDATHICSFVIGLASEQTRKYWLFGNIVQRRPQRNCLGLKLSREQSENRRSTTMPIGVGIIGLSATASWAVSAHLPYLKSSDKYEIVGVCNSSQQSSQKAIEAHGLSKTAKAYGSVADLAASLDVDLIVCSVRVDRHYEAMQPAIAAGKNCFIEWPLAANYDQAVELQQAAKKKGIKSMVGLQSQMSPAIARIKQLVGTEKVLGRIISSQVTFAASLGTSETTEPYEYLNSIEVGGNVLTIPFGHLYDAVSYTLGELQGVAATLSVQHPDVQVKGADGSRLRTIKRDAADHITISGVLESGAHSSATVYGGSPSPGESALVWRIAGEKGVLQVHTDHSFAISMSGDISIRLYLSEEKKWRDIDFVEDMPGPVGNVARLYEAFADDGAYPDWDWAVKRHAWVNAIYESNASGKHTSYI